MPSSVPYSMLVSLGDMAKSCLVCKLDFTFFIILGKTVTIMIKNPTIVVENIWL
jgi:hypothetical protein